MSEANSSNPSQSALLFFRTAHPPLGPSSSRSIEGEAAASVLCGATWWPNPVAQLGITQPSRFARSRGARTQPALTGVHLVISQGAFRESPRGTLRSPNSTIGRVTGANHTDVTLSEGPAGMYSCLASRVF